MMQVLTSLTVILAVAAQGGGPAQMEQVADPGFDASVAAPAYTTTHPRVLFDEAHHNFHTTTGRYQPFAGLLRNDGYELTPNTKPFTAASLKEFDALIIANALGEHSSGETSDAAFTDAECDAVRDWVRAGGALLLIADHAPMGSAAETLAARFEVRMGKGFVLDLGHGDGGNPTTLVFTRENGLLGDHPITRGRSDAERISKVLTFTGQSLQGPSGAASVLRLGEGARERPSRTAAAADESAVGGRSQGLAFAFGKGRVVVLGEAAMLSAQIVRPVGEAPPGFQPVKTGMNRPDCDNRQFALNVMHWLTGLLPLTGHSE